MQVSKGMHVTPKPFTFGRYLHVTPGKRYEVIETMTASEWFRKSVSPEFTMGRLTNDLGETQHHWYAFTESHWEIV